MDTREDRQGRGASDNGLADHAGLAAPQITESWGLPSVESFLADRQAERWAGGEPLRADASVSGTINRFSPRDVPGDVWRRVEPVVKEAVAKAAPGDPQMPTIS